MKNRPINVFIIDDEFPILEEFRRRSIYNGPIPTNDLYHLAVQCEWNHLRDLQQLIKDVVTSQACKEGLVELVGFASPTLALVAIEKGVTPDVLIYDWEYLNAPITSSNSKSWLLEILEKTSAFAFVYSKMRDQLPRFLNRLEFIKYSNRFQLFLKGGKVESSFSAEEFILQYIIGAASKSGQIKISGIEIEFTSNNYLSSASDLLYLQRILGNQYLLEELQKVNFSIDSASVEKILNDSNGYVLYSEDDSLLIFPDYQGIQIHKNLQKLSYLEVAKRYSIATLELVLERGIFAI